ncbi:PREDICTED: tetratricopeptide repeat protein 29, partial [Mandrillus leucophaeus]|uniref:tetratricopeptide repeat protein 29 n=1 Tax=Mandrillus leucophaeus TaxID=9568 RepID=UPI0005F36E4D
MTTLPPLPMTRPKLTALARQKLPCSSRKIPRSQLIKEKDDIDHYLEVNFKGLSKEEVAAYRNSYKKNICVDMLRDGYHKSFTELFALMEQWDALREAARVRSLFWLQKPLEEQPDKLDYFYHYLTRAEDAERKKSFEDVYNNLYALACYFNNPEDKWVRNHFYERCFKIAQLIKIDGGKKEAEAHMHMGLLYEEDGQLLEAAEHYEAFHQLTQGRIWKDETGRSLNLLACESLLRTYRLLSDKMLQNKEYKQAIKILIKASEIAKEGQLLEAAEHYEAFHQLTQGRIWKDETGRSLNLLACESLLRTYRLLADKMLQNKEYKQAIKILIKASEIAKE